MGFLDSAANAIQGVYHQVNPFDGGRTFDTNSAGQMPGYRQATAPTTTAPSYSSGGYKPDTSAADKAYADSNAAIKALQAQIAAQPKLPTYNTAAAWAQAQKQAESAVNPVYTDKLNAYLQKAQLARTQQEQQTATNKQGIQTDLSQNLEDVGTQRNRTAEDTASTLADLQSSEAFDQRTGGTAFDRARMALLGGVADAGLTTSGLGAQQDSNAIQDRNTQEAEQGRQYDNKTSATNLNLKRTNEDLDVNTGRYKGAAVTRTAAEDTTLKNFIDNASLDENSFRTDNEAARLSAVSGEVNNQYKVGVANFIQSLIGSGARAQDIALAQQVYG